MSHDKNQVVTTAEFMEASAKLPRETRDRLNKATSAFFHDNGSFDSDYETIQTVDSDIYSLGIDDNYCIIYKRPDNKNTFFLLYVGKHDDAYDWARTHITQVNPSTGGIQTSVALAPNIIREDGRIKTNPKLNKLSDTDMLKMGIPEGYWKQLRTQVFSPNQLVGYKDYLTYETYCVLEAMMNGLPYDEAMQMYEDMTAPLVVKPIDTTEIEPLFSAVTDQNLLKVGIPQQYLNLVRNVRTETELISLEKVLPEDAMQSLYALYKGESIEAILKLTYSDSDPVEDNDFEAALLNPITKSQFASIEDEEAFHALLEYPAAQWRVFLHPSQRRMIERHYGGPARIIGGAGTGKTVVIVHRAKYLTQFCGPEEKVLVTSYNKSLVADIRARLATICTQDELEKIEVIHVDGKTKELAKSLLRYVISYGDTINDLWDYALKQTGLQSKYKRDFVEDEWIYLVQAKKVETKEEYIKIDRRGRSKGLDRSLAREEVWSIFEAYMQRARSLRIIDSDWAQNLIANECLKNVSICSYHSVLVDECQDLRAPAFRMLRAMAGKQHQDDIFFSGDSRQRIYKGTTSLSQCGISINNRSNTLKINYRTTAEIYESAMKIQQGYQYDDLDGKSVDQDLCTCIFHGEAPVVRNFLNENEEWNAIVNDIKRRIRNGISSQDICILVTTNQKARECTMKLKREGLESLQLSKEQNDDLGLPGIRTATMYRVKGMEYACVYIPFLRSEYLPANWELRKCEDDAAEQELIKNRANLLSVAMTRAKRYVWLSYSGRPSRYLANMQ